MASAPGPYTVLRGHTSDVQALAFVSDTHFFSGDAEGMVHLWDMEERRSEHSQALHGLQSGILYLQLVHTPKHGRLLMSYGRDGMIKGWRLQGNGTLSSAPEFCISTGSYNFCRPHAAEAPTAAAAQQQHLQGVAHGKSSDATRAACDSHCLVAGAVAEDGAVCVWDVCRNGEEVLRLHRPRLPGPNSGTDALGGSSRGMCMAVQLISGMSSMDWRLLSGYEDGSVVLWDLASPQQSIADVRGGQQGVHQEPLLCLAARALCSDEHHDNKQGHQVAAVSGGTDANVACYTLGCGASSNMELGIAAHLQLSSPGVSDCDIRGDGRLFALACWDGKVRVHSTKAKRKCVALALLRHHTKEVTCLRFAPMPPEASHARQSIVAQEDGSSLTTVSVDSEFREQACVQVQGYDNARDEISGGDQGICSNVHGAAKGREEGGFDHKGVGKRGHGGWGDGPISAKHGTLISASRDGSIAVWHVFPP